eukprot:CAMPEP_0177384454 /NCGR_PEP_ID=MMETSP0368-20130122/49704_1 /TAXON_ID=447022 ORGANISM="Scrippsiella hangoei-like, Strain SHHI-4" /NCGR_SAMPLE_ID=MMETSP0368 /ASSEMBLY_ACC=CAM_ASM_000363 /LENGTH=86 /DNA_ID=CAMNT_0018849127 /DNA_START=117 /DNA_END=377 /DNA_ORIENTATION=+
MPLSTVSVRDAGAGPMVACPRFFLIAQARQVADKELVHGHEFVLDHDDGVEVDVQAAQPRMSCHIVAVGCVVLPHHSACLHDVLLC